MSLKLLVFRYFYAFSISGYESLFRNLEDSDFWSGIYHLLISTLLKLLAFQEKRIEKLLICSWQTTLNLLFPVLRRNLKL